MSRYMIPHLVEDGVLIITGYSRGGLSAEAIISFPQNDDYTQLCVNKGNDIIMIPSAELVQITHKHTGSELARQLHALVWKTFKQYKENKHGEA